MSTKYERNGDQVLRDGVVVAVINADGVVECTEDGQKYRPHIVRFVNSGDSDDDDQDQQRNQQQGPSPFAAAVAPTTQKITTTRQLIAAMQPSIAEPCPAMTAWEGDRTPAVLEWLKKHDPIRVNVLQANEVR